MGAGFAARTRTPASLRYLLRHPGREIHVSELLASLPDASAAASEVHASGRLLGDGNQFILNAAVGFFTEAIRQAQALSAAERGNEENEDRNL